MQHLSSLLDLKILKVLEVANYTSPLQTLQEYCLVLRSILRSTLRLQSYRLYIYTRPCSISAMLSRQVCL